MISSPSVTVSCCERAGTGNSDRRHPKYSRKSQIIPEKLEDLNERTKFLFFRDDPFRRFMIRSNEWLDFMERFYS